MNEVAASNPFSRSSGILLHVTSLPSPHGIGDLGPGAHAFADALARAKQSWWQMLPLGPTGYGDSPYQCFSAFAGNPLLVSPELLARDGLLSAADFAGASFPSDRVEFETVIPYKSRLLARAWENFQARPRGELANAFAAYGARQADWLDDFALFLALKERHGGGSWQDWPEDLLMRRPEALARAAAELHDRIGLHKFAQFLFARQWQALKGYARGRGVRFIGDMPIFVATDSADVWAHPELFLLDAKRRPKVVAGVPPDYFSLTGQLWGNPHYDWEAHRRAGYAWWIARLRTALEEVDVLRLDHFRGFEAAWQVPARHTTAEVGQWVPGAGADLFDQARAALGELALIAEDLGVITPEVDALRQRCGWPGMRILQFAFGGAPEARFLPHNYERHTVVYTGTHDNDTTLGWFRTLTPAELRLLTRYAPGAPGDPAWQLMRLAWASVADLALAPLQDVLRLGPEARMNVPGVPCGNWRWRFDAAEATEKIIDELGDMTEIYQRVRDSSYEAPASS